MSFHLRPAEPADRDFLFALFTQTMKSVIEQTWGWDDARQRADFDRRFESYDVAVVECDARPVGGLFLETAASSAFIHELQLLPEYQGRGIGSAIVQTVIDHASARGLPVALSVVAANPRAQRFYERLGFRVMGVESPFISMQRDPATGL